MCIPELLHCCGHGRVFVKLHCWEMSLLPISCSHLATSAPMLCIVSPQCVDYAVSAIVHSPLMFISDLNPRRVNCFYVCTCSIEPGYLFIQSPPNNRPGRIIRYREFRSNHSSVHLSMQATGYKIIKGQEQLRETPRPPRQGRPHGSAPAPPRDVVTR